MCSQNLVYNKHSENLLAKLPFGNENKEGIVPNEMNKSFLSIISHNIKNPFGALLGYSELLFEDYSELTDNERQEFSLDIKNAATLTYRYLERFFEWVYYKTDKIEPIFEELNLRNVIGLAVSRSLREQTYLGEINFNVDSDIRILADNESIVKVFYYIVENAVKYNNKDGLIIITAKEYEEFINVEIIDHGCGISEDKLNKLFDISINIVQNGSGVENGTGMGLILAKQLVSLNKGKINIESTQNYGTKVILKLPILIK